MKINTLEMIKKILEKPSLRFKTKLKGEEITAFYNQNGGISIGKSNLNMSGEIMGAKWEKANARYTFMEAINSKKKIKQEAWEQFVTISEALYDLLDYPADIVVELINGNWNIEEM